MYFLCHGTLSFLYCIWNRGSEASKNGSFVTLSYKLDICEGMYTSIGVNIWMGSLLWPFSFIFLNVVRDRLLGHRLEDWSIWSGSCTTLDLFRSFNILKTSYFCSPPLGPKLMLWFVPFKAGWMVYMLSCSVNTRLRAIFLRGAIIMCKREKICLTKLYNRRNSWWILSTTWDT